MLSKDLKVVDSRYEPAASCLVCGKNVPAGEGVTAHYEDRVLRFKCQGCYTRFQADPLRYLTGHAASCCDEPPPTHFSEWRAE